MTSRKILFGGVLAIVVALGAAARGVGQSQDNGLSRGTVVRLPDGSQPMVPIGSCEAAIADQNRVNRYFHQTVVPNLEGCWSGIRGAGTIAVQLRYARTGNVWEPAASTVRSSTLPRGEENVALGCLQQAVRGTSFAAAESDTDADALNVNWSFPVPWPDSLADAAVRMLDNGGGPAPGDCGGSEGPDPACFTCGFLPILSLSLCVPSCTGYSDCTRTEHGCRHSSRVKCLTGSVFGNIGGIVAYQAMTDNPR